jgi:hypothetical protein
MASQVADLLKDPHKMTFCQSIRIAPQLVARGILGHICSVGLNRYDGRLSKHVFDAGSDLLSEVRLSYWVYPYAGRTVLRDFSMSNIGIGKSAAMYVIKSYPLAFAMAWNKEFLFDRWQPSNFDRFAYSGSEDEVDLPLDFVGLPGQLWPEHVQGNHIAAMHSEGGFFATGAGLRKRPGR